MRLRFSLAACQHSPSHQLGKGWFMQLVINLDECKNLSIILRNGLGTENGYQNHGMPDREMFIHTQNPFSLFIPTQILSTPCAAWVATDNYPLTVRQNCLTQTVTQTGTWAYVLDGRSRIIYCLTPDTKAEKSTGNQCIDGFANVCNQQVGGSNPSTSSNTIEYGGIPEWPNGTDCKSAGNAFGGSNPPSPTKTTWTICSGCLLYLGVLRGFALK